MENLIENLHQDLIQIKTTQQIPPSFSSVRDLYINDDASKEWDIEGQMGVGQTPVSFYKLVKVRIYSPHGMSLSEIKVKAMINDRPYPYGDEHIDSHGAFHIDSFTSGIMGNTATTSKENYEDFTITLYANDQNSPPRYKLKIKAKTVFGTEMRIIN